MNLRLPTVALVVLLVALLTGCNDTVRLYYGPERPVEQLALIHPSSSYQKGVLSSQYGEAMGMGVSNKVLSTWPRIYLIAVDGVAVPGAGNKMIEVPAGKHTWKVRAIAAGGTNEVMEFEKDVKGGYSYNLAVFQNGDDWMVDIRPRARWRRG